MYSQLYYGVLKRQLHEKVYGALHKNVLVIQMKKENDFLYWYTVKFEKVLQNAMTLFLLGK
jgi:hypothetical protein